MVIILLMAALLIVSFFVLRTFCSAKNKWERNAEDTQQEKFCNLKKRYLKIRFYRK